MFERFSVSARRVVVRASDEARRLNHAYIGTEHVLLGLCGDGQSTAATALAELGLTLEVVRRQVEHTVGRGPTVPGGHIPFTERAKQTLQYALEECVRLGHPTIETHHLVVGLLRQEQSTAVRIIEALGSNPDRIRRHVNAAAVSSGATAVSTIRPEASGRPGEDDRLRRARRLYEDAVFGGDMAAAVEASRALDGVEADLALARGRVAHAEFLHRGEADATELAAFERAAELYQGLRDVRGEGEALLWIGLYHQVVRDDGDAALPYLQRSYELAGQVEDLMTMSYAVRHLGFADMHESRWDDARTKLEESVRLRRRIGFAPGVAAGLLALAELARAAGRPAVADRLLDEATEVATECRAHGVLARIDEARRADPQSG